MENLQFNMTEPLFLRNLMLYPIKNGSDNEIVSPATIDGIIENNKGEFREIDVPDVNRILFDNHGDSPVLMIDGEEITGSLQNRIIAQSTIVEAHSKNKIPVICAEERRWKEIGGFKTGYCSYPRIRSILASFVHKRNDLQKEVWKEIDRKITITKTRTKTSSMHEIFENLNDEVERYLEGFETLNHNTIGFIGIAGNKILGCDIFCSPGVYQKFEEKLLRSYILDAIEYQRSQNKTPNVKDFWNAAIHSFSETETKTKIAHKSLRYGKVTGQILFYNRVPVHLSAFPA